MSRLIHEKTHNNYLKVCKNNLIRCFYHKNAYVDEKERPRGTASYLTFLSFS